MKVSLSRERPAPWSVRSQDVSLWALPLVSLDWVFDWVAFALSKWTFLAVLQHLQVFSVLIAAIFYFSESGDRVKQKHYQAWQVINTAQGKGGSGGRVEALQELNADGIWLVGVDLSGAFLQGINLEHGRLLRSNFSGADMRNSHFVSADFSDANCHAANFRDSTLRNAVFSRADLEDSDFSFADLVGADFAGADLANTDLRDSEIDNVRWQKIRAIKGANIYGVKNPPDGFVEWAKSHGAVQNEAESD